MGRRGSILGAIFALVVAASVGTWPAAAAPEKPSQKSSKATVAKKAWFYSAPPCAAVDCAAVPPLNPYPEDTLHVAISAGQETARTYLALEFELPKDTEPTGGTLELPVDADATHGSVNPETANIVACASNGKFEDERGATTKPPEVDCEVRRSAVYNEKRASFSVDLSRFADLWDEAREASGDGGRKWEAAVALVPSSSAQAGGETWHAVFPATDPPRKKADRDETPVIAVTVEYGPAKEEGGGLPPPPPPPIGGGSGGSFGGSSDGGFSPGSGFDSGSGFGSGSSGTPSGETNDGVGSFGSAAGATDTAAGAPATTPGQVAAPPGSLVGFAGPGFAYPIMWALPLVILLGLTATGRALTKDLYRRGL